MNSLIESLNMWGERFFDLALPIFWQSCLLIALIFGIDWLLRRRIRPAVRYALWLVVMVKLILPPTLALPTGAAWWLRMHKPVQPEVHTQTMTVSEGPSTFTPVLLPAPALTPLPPPKLSSSACVMLSSIFVSILLLAWAAFRWWKISRRVRETIAPTGTISELFEETRRNIRVRKNVQIRLTTETMSPAVCGLWRPIVLLPQSLIEKLSPEQLRAVLLHELVHVRRGDVWINCAQTLLQIIYWWHPLVWFANTRIRRMREDAVDDAVMVALNDQAEIYAPTLLEVAKLAFSRPLAGLGIIGILESRAALRHRIERLLNFKTPGRAGLSAVWILALAAFTAVAVPMGEAPEKSLSAPTHNDSIDASMAANTPQADTNHVEPLFTRTFQIKTNPIYAALHGLMFDTDSRSANLLVITLFSESGIDLYSPRSVFYSDREGTITVHTGTNDLDRIEKLLTALNTDTAALQHARALVPSPTNIIHTSPSRQKILQKLNNITFDQISFTNATLHEVIQTLAKQTPQHDPEHEGMPFLIDKASRTPNGAAMDTSQVRINTGELKDMRLLDVLEAITKNSDWPIKYSIQDYGVEFSFRGTPLPELHTRLFIVDSNALYLKLEQIGLSSTNAPGMLENFFKAAGISLAPPKSFYFNATGDKLNVRATVEELDLIARLLPRNDEPVKVSSQVVFTNPPSSKIFVQQTMIQDAKTFFERGELDKSWTILQMILSEDPNNQAALYYSGLIKQARSGKPVDGAQGSIPPLLTRTFKLDESTLRMNLSQIKSFPDIQSALTNFFQKAGVDLKQPKRLFFNDRAGTLTVHATENDLDMLEQIIMTMNIVPPQVTIKARFIEIDADNSGIDALVKKSLVNPRGKTNAWTGILTPAQFAPVLQALQKRQGAKLLNEGEIITLSGRQANFEIVDVKTLVTGLNATVTNNQTRYDYKTDAQSFGSTLDVLPIVSGDTNTVTITVTPRITEFLGYENPKEVAKYDEKLKGAQLPLPKTRVRQTTTVATIRDGQTLVIGNLGDQSVITGPDGTTSRQPYNDKKKKQLLIFITVNIIDPSGHFVHSRDYYDNPAVY